MINNDTLLGQFRSARKHHRSAWGSHYGYASRTWVPPVPPTPNVNLLQPQQVCEMDTSMGNCGLCGEYDYVAMFTAGACQPCLVQAALDWELTMEAITREEHAKA